MPREHLARGSYEGDVERDAHEAGMHRGAARKRERIGGAVGGASGDGQHAQKPRAEPSRHDEAGTLPTERLQGGPGGAGPQRPLPHRTTPGRHGSTVTERSWASAAGAPRETPATEIPCGHGMKRMVQV